MSPAIAINDQKRQQALSVAQRSGLISSEAPCPSFVPPPPPPTKFTAMRSTESKTRLERGNYLKKRSIDFITYQEGCPIDKHSQATVRDEDPFTEESGGSASRDDCSSGSGGDGGDQQQQETLHKSSTQEDVHPLYVIQKKGTKSNQNQSTRVSKAYSFEEYWKIFDSVVEGCRCISIAGCATGGVNTPATSFGNSIDEADASSAIVHQGPVYGHNRSLVHTPVGDSNNDCYYGHVTPHNESHNGVHRQIHPSPISSTANVGSIVSSSFSCATTSPKDNTNTPISYHTSSQQQRMPSLLRELSDDDDFRPAHRTSACFVLHEKDKINSIFRD